MPLQKFWPILLLLMPALCLASVNASSLRRPLREDSLAAREHQLWGGAVHDSEFAAVPHTSARINCEATRPPEALATPNPLFERPDATARITVSIIIGTDGRVHSPLIMESAGEEQDRTVLDTVRSWRYRPATCNGVPTEAEGKIEFSSR